MARGKAAKDGDTNVSKNGYHYTRVDGKWRLTHHLLAEELLGHPLDTKTHMVRFKDGDKTNLKIENIEVIKKGVATPRRQIARLTATIAELTAQKEYLERAHGLS